MVFWIWKKGNDQTLNNVPTVSDGFADVWKCMKIALIT